MSTSANMYTRAGPAQYLHPRPVMTGASLGTAQLGLYGHQSSHIPHSTNMAAVPTHQYGANVYGVIPATTGQNIFAAGVGLGISAYTTVPPHGKLQLLPTLDPRLISGS